MSINGTPNARSDIRGNINKSDVLVVSAYDIAVKHGFEGTEKEWINSTSENARRAEEAKNAAEIAANNAGNSVTEAAESAAIAATEAAEAEVARLVSEIGIDQSLGDSATATVSQSEITDIYLYAQHLMAQHELCREDTINEKPSIEMGKAISIKTGVNIACDGTHCRTAYRAFTNRRAFGILSDEYEFIVWCYSGLTQATATYSPTPKWARNQLVIVEDKQNTSYFRVCVRRTDGAVLTTDTEDENSDYNKIRNLMFFGLPRIVQTTGDDTKAIMSQKSVTDELAKIPEIVQEKGDDDAAVMSQNAVTLEFKNALQSSGKKVLASNYATYLPDFNDAPVNSIYHIDLNCVEGTVLNNPMAGRSCVLMTFGWARWSRHALVQQCYGLGTGTIPEMMFRYGFQQNSETYIWTPWKKVLTGEPSDGELPKWEGGSF